MQRAVRIGTGTALVVAGVAMLVLPGPGVMVLLAGLVALRGEVPLADRLLLAAERRFPSLAGRDQGKSDATYATSSAHGS